MPSRWDAATHGWSRRVFHYPLPTLMSRNFRLPCTIELQPLSLTLLKMRKVELRGCFKSWGACQAAEHESDHSGVDPGFGGFRQCFIILAQSPVPAQPGESALHHPASGQHLKTVAVLGTPHYLQSPTRQCRHPLDQLSGVAAIRPDQAQPGKPSGQLANDQLGPIPVLHVGWVHRHRQPQSLGIHHNMPFAAFHLLARVVPPRPPFSVVFFPWSSPTGCR